MSVNLQHTALHTQALLDLPNDPRCHLRFFLQWDVQASITSLEMTPANIVFRLLDAGFSLGLSYLQSNLAQVLHYHPADERLIFPRPRLEDSVYSEQDPIPIDTDDQLSDYFSTIYRHQDNTVFLPIMVEEECRLFEQMVRRYEERLAREKELQHKHINVIIPPDLQEALQDAQFEIRMMSFVEELRREFFPDPDGSSPLDIALRCRLASTFIKSGRKWEGTLSNDIIWLGIIYICESKRLFEKHSLIAIMRRSRGNP